jgi:hypothetical protein
MCRVGEKCYNSTRYEDFDSKHPNNVVVHFYKNTRVWISPRISVIICDLLNYTVCSLYCAYIVLFSEDWIVLHLTTLFHFIDCIASNEGMVSE